MRELKELFQYADDYGYREWLQFDASVVRGLAYYTGVVFEAFHRAIPRAICGGGRYDRLLSLYGSQDVAACGFGFGDCVIMEILQEERKIPALRPAVDDVVAVLSEELRGAAIRVACKLRQKKSRGGCHLAQTPKNGVGVFLCRSNRGGESVLGCTR